jgi:hypothetical protein
VPVPEHLDLGHYRGRGLQLGEEEMPQAPSTASATTLGTNADASSATTSVEADELIVTQLMEMGFSVNSSRRAAVATANANAEVAANWCFEVRKHMHTNTHTHIPTHTHACSLHTAYIRTFTLVAQFVFECSGALLQTFKRLVS